MFKPALKPFPWGKTGGGHLLHKTMKGQGWGETTGVS